jgi:hypothetical protein
VSNWVLETRSQVFARANPNVNFTFFLDNIMLFVFFLGFLTSACENKPLHVLYYLFTFCESVWARVLEINSQVSSHAYVISGHLLRSDPVGKHKHFKIWCVFVEKSCNIFLELIHVVKGFLCFFLRPGPPPYSSNHTLTPFPKVRKVHKGGKAYAINSLYHWIQQLNLGKASVKNMCFTLFY